MEYQSFENPLEYQEAQENLEYQDAQENLEYQNIGENNFFFVHCGQIHYGTRYIVTHLYCCPHGRMEAGRGFEHETLTFGREAC